MNTHVSKSYVVVILLIVVVVAALAGWARGQETTTIQVVERAETDAVADVGDEGDSVGDILTFANKVFDENNENQLGTDQGFCFRTVVGAAWECAWTLTLDDGQITVQGPFYDAGDSVLSITGGTGAYADVRGQMKLHARNDQGTEFDFVYELTR